MAIGNYMSNSIRLQGTVGTDPQYSHTLFEETFYTMMVYVPRLSGHVDVLPVTVSQRLLEQHALQQQDPVTVQGQLRSYNRMVDGKSRLILTVFARHISCMWEQEESLNTLTLQGFVCREPNYRTTPFHREITDLLIAVNRPYGKSDYIPCITWGYNARRSKELPIGTYVELEGRLQSREYEKLTQEQCRITKVAYEVSVNTISF